jgi:23S rRNA (uracil1939-C5)-methyltransferase
MIDRKTGGYRLGLFDRFRTGIVDLQGCPQLSPALESWLHDFRRFEFPVTRGSVRLRVAPDGTRGVWLDFANIDVKSLLVERTRLDSLLASGAVVEIGQRRKRLVVREGQLKLTDAVLFPWFETYIDGRSIPLYCSIGSFTQPGFHPNHVLIDEVMTRAREFAKDLGGAPALKRAAEFGSGIGNLTLPLSSMFAHVDAYEVDVLAIEGLKRTLADQARTNVTIHSGNYQGDKALALDFKGIDLLLVDPPRSGLMKFLDPLVSSPPEGHPQAILYISCFAESFAADSERLLAIGYQLEKLSIVDQFPQSRHYESVALFKKAETNRRQG